jgi:hypothetical protein
MTSKERFCYVCGDSLGLVEDRDYARGDTCGKPSCEREVREEERQRRDDAHHDLDDRMGWR